MPIVWPRENYFIAMLPFAEEILRKLEPRLRASAHVAALAAGPAGTPPSALLGAEAPAFRDELVRLCASLPAGSGAPAREALFMAAAQAAYEIDHRATIFGFRRIIAQHHVVPVIRVDELAFKETLGLSSRQPRIPRGLVEATIFELLGFASNELARTEPGEMTMWMPRDPEAIFRQAGSQLLDRVATRSQNFEAIGGLFDRLTTIATLPYENRAAMGTLVMARENHPSIALEVRFGEHGPLLREAKAARKVIEMSTRELFAVASGERIVGLAREAAKYDDSAEDRFDVHFRGPSRWELRHGATTLVDVQQGVPRPPRPPLSLEAFRRAIEARVNDADVPALWAVVESARKQRHGTMVIVKCDADVEVARFHPQALRTTPSRLTPKVIEGLTTIDGALLLDARGMCHGVGVIVDGKACGRGETARGARYNSALRYVDEHLDAAAVVVSEDGWVDVFPPPEG